MTKKNTYIELWRFVFCCIILIHHSGSIGNANTNYLFPAGFLAVEFGYFGVFYAGPIAWITAAVIVTIGYFINIRRIGKKFA